MIRTQSSLEEAMPAPVWTRLLQWSTRLFQGRNPVFALLMSVGTQVCIVLINILTGVISARLLGPEGRGEYAAVTTWPVLLSNLAFAGLNSAIVFRLRRFPESAGRIAAAALLLSWTQTLLAIALGWWLLPALMVRYPPGIVHFAQWCLLCAMGYQTYSVMKQCYAGMGAFRRLNFASLWQQVIYLAGLLLMVPLGSVSAPTAALALLGSPIIATLTTVASFWRRLTPRFAQTLREMRDLLAYSSRASVTDIVFALATYSDRLVLIPLLPAGELGIYAVAFSFSRVIQLVQPAITSVIFSHMAGRSESGGKHVHDHALRFLLAGLLAGIAIFWAVGEPLLVLAYGSDFGAANRIFRLLLVEASLGVLSQVTIQLLLSRDRPGVASAIQTVVLMSSLGALLVLVPRYGAVGAAAGLALAGALRFLLLLASVKLVLKLPLPRLYLRRDDFQYLLGRLH